MTDVHRRKQQNRKERRERYEKRRAEGLCSRCEKPAVKGKTRCEEHLEQHREQYREQYRKRYEERKAEELCVRCGEPAVPGKTCLLYTSPSPRDRQKSRMPSSA